MSQSCSTERQIVAILEAAEAGLAVGEVCRQQRISSPFGGCDPAPWLFLNSRSTACDLSLKAEAIQLSLLLALELTLSVESSQSSGWSRRGPCLGAMIQHLQFALLSIL
jgi:hypothetical protein